MIKLMVWFGIVSATVAGCGKRDSGAGSTAGSGASPVSAGAPTKLVTQAKIDAVGAQKSRLDEVSALLDNTNTLRQAISLLNTFRQQPSWQQLAATSDKLQAIDAFVAALGDGVKQLDAFQGGLKDASRYLGDIQGELTELLGKPEVAAEIDELRAKINLQVDNLVTTVETQTVGTIQKVLVPIRGQLSDISDLIIGGCALAKVSGGGDQLKELCTQAKDILGRANAFLADLDKRPHELITQLTAQLKSAVGDFLNHQSEQLLATAQTAVDAALELPGASGSGSAAGSGSAR